MNEAVVKTRLADLMDLMNGLNPFEPGKASSVGSSYVSEAGRSLEETFDHLQVQVRYLMFDLEATRRENKYLRQMLDGRPHLRQEDDPGQNPPSP